jgi:hypothetical protein
MYKAADHATGKPLVFCQRCEKQLAHPNNNNTSAGLSAPISNQSPVEEALPTCDFLIERVKAPGK